MKKRLMLISSYSVHLLNFYELIKEYFDEIFIITNKHDNRFHNLRVVNFSLLSTFKTSKVILKEFDQFSPSIVHIHQANSVALQSVLALKNKNIPILLTFLGSDVLHTPNKSLFHKFLFKYSTKKIQFFTSDSVYMAEIAQSLMSENKKILIANFGVKTVKNEEILKENIVYSNRLHKKFYRIDRIIDEFHRFRQSRINENWKLVIGATGEETDNLKEKVKVLNLESCVDFVGWLNSEQNSYFYNKSKLFVAIPENDATSISLLEAMNAGCVPFVINVPSNREWILDGCNGVLINDINSNFLESIDNLNFDLLKEVNRKMIESNGTIEVNKKRFIDFYEEILVQYKINA
jgi:glycosyltransferase involved in cell wall biosynthesis